MADTNTGGDAAEQNAGAPAEGTENSPTDSQAEQGSGDGAGDEGGDAGDGEDDEEGDDEDGSGDGDDDEDSFQDDGADPTVRDSSYYIGMRHGKKAAKAAKKDTDQGKGDDDDEDGGTDGDDDDDIHPEDREILNDAVRKAVEPLTSKLAEQEDAKELQAFLTGNPAFKPYEKRIERFMKHPTRKHLPVATVAMEAVGPEGMMKIGARMARSADHKKQTSKSAPGNGPRGGGNAKSVWDMDSKSFEAMQNEVRRKA